MIKPLPDIYPELRDRFQDLCGPELKELILFGSRARGEAKPDSDVDLLVVLDGEEAIRRHRESANDVICELSLKYDTVVSCVFTTPETWKHSGMPFYRNVRREGVPL